MRIAITVLAAVASTAVLADDIEPFPDDWFFYGAERPAELREMEGEKAPDFTAAEWRGEEASLADLKGKVVVLDFWATWCGPCMAAIPKNVAMVDKYKKDGLAFIGMHDARNGWSRVDEVIESTEINYPVALDDGGVSTKAYNVPFWPTYVLIDRNGVVRAAGMSPAHVEEAVKILLEEPYDGAPAVSSVQRFPDEYFFGAEKRPSWLKAAEGRKLKAIDGAAWSDEPLEAKSWAKRVTVVQFVKPSFAKSFDQLEALKPAMTKLTKQGVVFVAVCDVRADWDEAKAQLEARKLDIPMAWDAPAKEEGAGVTARAFGVRFSQPLAVVDRAGVIRAVGVRPEHLEDVVNTLLAERLAPATQPEDE